MSSERPLDCCFAQIFAGFIAGFLATLVFHQLVLAALWHAGIAPFPPFPMAATRPFGVPAVHYPLPSGVGYVGYCSRSRKAGYHSVPVIGLPHFSLAPCSLRCWPYWWCFP